MEGWLTLAATQCSVAKDGTFVETPIEDIIATIISPHDRAYSGLCFPQSWDPLRPLKIEGNSRKKLEDNYGVPVACGCNYDIPLLKSLPKPKKPKKIKSTDTKTDKKDKKDKVKDANKNIKNKPQASSSKSDTTAESSNKTTKTKESQVNKSDESSDTKMVLDDIDSILDVPDEPNLMEISEGAN